MDVADGFRSETGPRVPVASLVEPHRSTQRIGMHTQSRMGDTCGRIAMLASTSGEGTYGMDSLAPLDPQGRAACSRPTTCAASCPTNWIPTLPIASAGPSRPSSGATEVVVGRDMRVSGPALSAALIDGLRDQGANVTDIGLVSTDTLYFAVGKYGYQAGVMITASHNPAAYNGFKICREEARALSMETGIGDIRDLVVSGNIPDPCRTSAATWASGRARRLRRACPRHDRCLPRSSR